MIEKLVLRQICIPNSLFIQEKYLRWKYAILFFGMKSNSAPGKDGISINAIKLKKSNILVNIFDTIIQESDILFRLDVSLYHQYTRVITKPFD